METELRIEGVGLPPLSARGCVQTLEFVQKGAFRRTVNGELLYLAAGGGDKYRSVIRCEDKTTPTFDGIMQGSIVRVGCLQRLWQEGRIGHPMMLTRDPVEGSICALDGGQVNVPVVAFGRDVHMMGDQNEAASSRKGEIVYVSYRPWLKMCVMQVQALTDEWGMRCGWQMALEEV